MILGKDKIRFLIRDAGLVKDYVDLGLQLAENGFDLTVKEILELEGPGQLGLSGNETSIPFAKDISPRRDWYSLKRGIYLVTANEQLNLPENISAFLVSTEQLVRIGASIEPMAWGPGFNGVPQFVIRVENGYGARIKKDGKIARVAFVEVDNSRPSRYGKLI